MSIIVSWQSAMRPPVPYHAGRRVFAWVRCGAGVRKWPQRRFAARPPSFRSRRWSGLVSDAAKTTVMIRSGSTSFERNLQSELSVRVPLEDSVIPFSIQDLFELLGKIHHSRILRQEPDSGAVLQI